jgi:polyhydroxybutyrate depolymerase
MMSVLAAAAFLLGACAAGDRATEVTTAAPAASTQSSSANPGDGARTPAAQTITLDVDGETRRYTLLVPQDLGATPAALVIDLHGLSESADEEDERSGMRRKATEEGFVVAQPEGRSALKYWESSAAAAAITGDVAFLRAVVDDVSSMVPIDPNRVYATGLSNGGGMANRLACEAADVFAAVAPVAGAHTQDEDCDPVRPMPMLIFHGDADRVVPYTGVGELFPPIDEYASRWAIRNRCDPVPEESRIAVDVVERRWIGCEARADVVLYIVEGGGHGWPGTTRPEGALVTTASISATDLMWEFFEAHPLP